MGAAAQARKYDFMNRARERNVGWRIDYQVAAPGIAKKARAASIHMADVFPDHAPVTIDYDDPI